MKPFSIIVAVDSKNGIGKNGRLPWHLPADLKHFRAVTSLTLSPDKQNAVIMGRKTWESIPQPARPLACRINIVITRDTNYALPDGVLRAGSMDGALDLAEEDGWKDKIDKVFVIGGQQIFEQALSRAQCRSIIMTRINKNYHCDTFFLPIGNDFSVTKQSAKSQSEKISYQFFEYTRQN